ncbi:hypothetical protein VEE68_35520 [Escherichia coli]|nr:hypothetical protein VEE68_35520 [Escherichia coli]
MNMLKKWTIHPHMKPPQTTAHDAAHDEASNGAAFSVHAAHESAHEAAQTTAHHEQEGINKNINNTPLPPNGGGDGQVKPERRKAERIDYESFLNAYNTEVGDRLPHAVAVNEKRKRRLKKIIPQLKTPNVDGFRAYVRAFVHQAKPFYFGDNDTGWTADFDYLLREDSLTGVREGKFADRGISMRQDIEASVIGGLLIGGLTPTASDVLATLEPEAFSIPLYRRAFEVIRKQARNRNLIDALMVAEACGEEHFTSILMTSKNCPSAANLKGYAGMVADNYHRRLVLEIMDEMREPIQSGTIDASSQAMDELVKRLSAIRKPRDEVKPVRLGEIITDYTDTLDRRLRNGEESDTLKTGIEELDAITGGMNAEDLVIIAARPGMGKTELALKIAEGVASRVIPGSDVRRGVLIFSMEMSALQIAERSIANAGRMSVSVLRNPAAMDDEGWARVANGMSQLADLDVWVVDASRLSVEEIRSIAERHKQENPNLSLIMADYLGLIEKPKADRNDLAIAHISGSLKAMAKDLKTPVISLSQLSRDVEKRPNKRPTNADLRDSGSIEQDADSIIMLYREAVYDENSSAAPFAEIIVTKNRFGSLGTVYQRFCNGHFVACDQDEARQICTASNAPAARGRRYAQGADV